MLFTRQIEYALRAIRALSNHTVLTAKEICHIESIPYSYSYKILSKLEKNAIIISTRGIYGGYSLPHNIDSISLYDVYFAIEGDFNIINFLIQHEQTEESESLLYDSLSSLQHDIKTVLSSSKIGTILQQNKTVGSRLT